MFPKASPKTRQDNDDEELLIFSCNTLDLFQAAAPAQSGTDWAC